MKIFDLQKGDLFKLNDKEYIHMGYIRKFMPTIGKVINAKVIGKDGKVSLFYRYNPEVQMTEEK